MSDTVFTPDERATLADPVIRKPGHKTESIVLADEASYLLSAKRQDGAAQIEVDNSAFTPGTYKVSFDGFARFPEGGRFEAFLTFRPIDNGQNWDTVSDGAASADTDIRITSIQYDHAGGNIEQELLATTDVPHNLKVGQYVRIRMDSDLTAATAFATGSTIGAINAEYRVEFVSSNVVFSVSYTAGTVDDADDAALDANLYAHPTAEVTYHKTIRDIELLDTQSSAVIGGDWDGRLTLTNRTEDVNAVFIVDAGAVSIAVSQHEIDDTLDYDTDGSDASQGVEIAATLMNVYNEDAATNVYDVQMENSPIRSEDLNGYACFYLSERNLILKNRLGVAMTFEIERVS